MLSVGINESQNERNEIKTITKNGIRFALLNYTYGTNGIKIPADKSWALNLIDKKRYKMMWKRRRVALIW